MVFRHTENRSWFNDAEPQCSIKTKLSPWEGDLTGAHWDYEYILPLFLQIRNVKMVRMYSTEMFEESRENMMMRETFLRAQRIVRKTILYESTVKTNRYHGR
jgi:hypothetical protein